MQNASVTSDGVKVVKTSCACCHLACGIEVHVENGKVIKIEGMKEAPLNRGGLCVKGRHAADELYSDERLLYPMKKENGEWQRISWDEALDTIAGKLNEYKEKHGPNSLMIFVGDPGITPRLPGGLAWTFCEEYGTKTRVGPNSICWEIRHKAHKATAGKLLLPEPEYSKCIVLWGNNPHKSNVWHVQRINTALENGAKLIVIDPRRTPFAKRADIHVNIRPGTDAALGLALMNVMIAEGLYDKDFIENWTYGFEELAEHVKQYSPEEVEKITWVAAEDIRKIARMFAATKPACIIQGTNCLDQQASGFQNSRIMAILEALTANIDVKGGYIRVRAHIATHPFEYPEWDSPMLGGDQYPVVHRIHNRVYGESQAADWPKIILNKEERYPVKAMIVNGANPAVSYPNSKVVEQALEAVEFVVVMDMYMTPTAEHADIVLPACTFLERTDICDIVPAYFGPAPWAILRQPAVPARGESRPDGQFWLDLGKRMGYHDRFPWNDLDEVLNYFLEPSGLTVETLKQDYPCGIETSPILYNEYKERGGFGTPTGKFEFYSKALEEYGLDPLPMYYENPETPLSDPELAEDYPLILTTGARILEFWHSQHRNVPGLRRRVPDPTFEINPETARKHNIADGEWAIIETKRGSIEIKTIVTEDIAPEVVCVPHGWREANANILTDNTPADPVSGYPIMKGLQCRIRKKA